MTVPLRDFQAHVYSEACDAWRKGAQNVCMVAPCGAGKTVILSHAMQDEPGASLAVAHRQELVSQISMALARNGLPHRLMSTAKGATSPLLRAITAAHVYEFGRSYLSQNARTGVVGVDTLIRHNASDPFFESVRLLVQDEAHHVLSDNKWGKAAAMLPNARGLYPTATPTRADGKGLGREHSGIMDAMVQAPSMRDIIDMGFLTDYRIYCPVSSKLHRERIKTTSSGEFNQADAAREVREAQIVGDTVQAYLRHAKGTRAVVFCVSVEEAERTAEAFRAAGIRAAALSADSPDAERLRVIGDLRAGRLDVLTNVDLFGEGFDLPAIETVIMARPTMSFGLYVQQFCRALRLLLPEWVRPFYNALSPADRRAVLATSDKPVGIIIDQVGNVEAHGLPDAPREWDMGPRSKGKAGMRDPDNIPLRVCLECYRPYERVHVACPYCGAAMPAPAERSGPEHVEGDLVELSPDVLAALRGEIARIDAAPRIPYGASGIVAASIRKKHEARQGAQAALRNAIAWWAGYRAACGDSEREGYRRFWYRYGVDVATAQTLGAGEASELAGRVMSDLQTAGVQFQPTNGN